MRRFAASSEAEEGSAPTECCSDEEPIHILMIALKAVSGATTDEELAEKFRNFCLEKVLQWPPRL